jgi:hypothetical protein
MQRKLLWLAGSVVLMLAGYVASGRGDDEYATVRHGTIPKTYGRLVTAIPDQIGTGLVFEDNDGVIRFVAVTGMKEGELARY